MSDSIDFQKLASQQEVPKFDHSVEDIKAAAAKIIKSEKAVYDAIAAVENPTIENVLKPYLKVFQENAFLEGQVTFYSMVSAQKELRDASTEAEKELDKHSIDLGLRLDVFKVFKKLNETVDHDSLDAETNRLLEKILLQFTRNGLDLPEEKRKVYKEYKLKLSELAVEFSKTMNEQTEYLLFTKEELDGVPEDVINEFEEEDGKLKMTYKYPDLFPVLKYATNPETRKKAFLGNQSKCVSNADVLTEMIKLRFKVAKLLGYKTFSEFVLEERMAKNQSNVLNFLNDLREKLTPLGKTELETLKQLKKEKEGDEEFYQWDMAFYNNLLLEQKYQVDHQKIQEYFPLDHAISQMLSFYEKLFDVKFHKIESPPSDTLWHEDVRQYAIFQDIKTGNKGPRFMGFIYFDLHPRDGKYGHACNSGIGPGFEKEDGSRQTPVTVLICNFTKPTKEKVSLLKHNELTTFFHELGHGVHSILAETKYMKFHGTRVPRDFVEAPSQMLEFWTWTKNELKQLSSHYETGEPISDDLVDQLINSKNVNNGLHNLRQLHFGLFDMTLHTIEDEKDIEELDLNKTWNQMREDITMMSTAGIETPGFASFAHIAHGYESGYYGYLYSQVFANDIFYTLFKDDPMNVESGLRYRDTILKRGNSREMMSNLEELLGRKPTSDAFLQELLG